MGQKTEGAWGHNRWLLTLDGWAVAAALFAALLVRAGILKHIPW